MAISGTFGCAPVSFHWSGRNDAAKPAAYLPAPPGDPDILPSALVALIRRQDVAEAAMFEPIAIPREILESNGRAGGAVAPPDIKVSKPSETKLATAQRPVEPQPVDHLLDLVENDLKKGVEQTTEGRRLPFSKAVIENPRVRYFINYFSKSQRGPFADALARSGKYFPMMAKVLRDEGLPEDFAYLALIESYFLPKAWSRAGAVGLWQFVPMTARRYGLRMDHWVDERRDPIKSTRAAAMYLKDLHLAFDRWYLATAAYNAGQSAIEKLVQSAKPKDFAALIGRTKLSQETRNFVPKFVAAVLIATDPQKYGFADVVQEAQPEYEEVEVQGELQLSSLAEMGATNLDSVRELNPALLRAQTPPDATYQVRLPAGHASTFELAYDQAREPRSVEVVTHEVKKGETLFSIARRYGQRVRALMELNGLSDSRLRIGQKLKIFFAGLRDKLR